MKYLSTDMSHFMESIPDPLIVIDSNQMILLVNESTESLFGYSREFLTGKTLRSLVLEQDYQAFVNYYMQQDEKPIAPIEVTGVKKNNIEFPMELYCSFMQEQHITLITIKDLTCRIELGSKNEALVRANQIKDQFVSTMCHQLKTPLNAVLGFSEILLLKLGGDLTSEQEKHISIINKSGKNLLALINDLSELAAINSGDVTAKIMEIDAKELILDVMNTAYTLAEKKSLQITNKLPNKPVFCKSDKQLLSQIISNIINNAIKFTDQGTVSVELIEDKEHVFIHIIDTGVGIKEEKMDYLYKPFQQVVISEKKSEGSGIGLHISKKLADLLQVKLEACSQYGKGTHFIVTIPKELPSQIKL